RHGETGDLDGVVEGDELQQMERHAVAHALEPAVPLSVSGHVGPARLADRQRGRAPELAGLVIPDIDRLARRVTHRVVGPRGELMLAAVYRPRVAGAGLGHLEAEARIGDHVDTGGGRPLS